MPFSVSLILIYLVLAEHLIYWATLIQNILKRGLSKKCNNHTTVSNSREYFNNRGLSVQYYLKVRLRNIYIEKQQQIIV